MPQAVEQSAAEILALLTGEVHGQNQSLEAQFEAIRDALQAALVGGGGGGGALTDPLVIGAVEATDYLSVGSAALADPDVARLTVQGANSQIEPLILARAGVMPAFAIVPGTEGSTPDTDLLYTANATGTAGNAITVAYSYTGNPSEPLAVSVVGNAITVVFQGDGAGVPISTALQIMAAVNASGAAHALVTASLDGYSDGTGVLVAPSTNQLGSGTDAASDVWGLDAYGSLDMSAPLTLRAVSGQSAHIFRAYGDDGLIAVDIDYQGALDARHIVVQNPPDSGSGSGGAIVVLSGQGSGSAVIARGATNQNAFSANYGGDSGFALFRRTGLGTDNGGYLELNGYAAADTLLQMVMHSAPTSDQVQLWNSAYSKKLFRIAKDGGIVTAVNAAPADGDLSPGDCEFWFDATNGAAKVMAKAKTLDGTVVAGVMGTLA